MRRRKYMLPIIMFMTVSVLATSCGGEDGSNGNQLLENSQTIQEESGETSAEITETVGTESTGAEGIREENNTAIHPSTEMEQLEDGLSAVSYAGADGFEEFLSRGGASSDAEVLQFLTEVLATDAGGLEFGAESFGCSTLSVQNPEGDFLFGRNFDWNHCEGLIVLSQPEEGYSSISTVNMDFIGAGTGLDPEQLPEPVRVLAALYAPLDGMNEEGLCVSVNMIQDGAEIEQDTGKPNLTTTTAIRLLLNQAADVEEALELLSRYDLHGSMGMMVHFALADADGRSVVVEYIDNQMVVTETPVVTNFYLAEGGKNGIGTAQSHTRYEMLTEQLSEKQNMTMEEVRDALDSVSKDNFGEYESTEWSIVYNQSSGEVRYYHRENYGDSYTFYLKQEGE